MSLRRNLNRVADLLPRPLDPIRSIKLKLSILLVVSGSTALAYFYSQIGWLPTVTSITALSGALVMAQILAHGMTRPLREMTAAAKEMAQGDYTRRIRVTGRDEVGELGRAFNQMSADLAVADQRRRELIANVSHELRTPIAALQAVLENAVDGVSPANPTTMRTALGQAERLGRLITELLDLSKIDAGAHTLDREVIDVDDLFADVVAEAEVNAVAAGRAVRFSTSAIPDGTTVLADRERLHQVLVNLLDNAVRHGPIGGEVRLTARAASAGSIIEVHDDGPGIAPDERRLVFQRFTRGERARAGGTGLGLAIARWVVDLHGGTIAVVDPEPTTRVTMPGCRIRITLPAAA